MDNELTIAAQRDLERVQAAVAASGDIAYEWEMATDRLTWSGNAGVLKRFAGGSVSTGAEFVRRILPEDMLNRRRLLEAHFRLGALFDCEYRISDGVGNVIWVHERGSARRDPQGRAIGIVGTLRIVTQRKRREARLRYEAHHDRLTGFYNRARLAQSLDDLIAYNRRYGQTGAYFAVGIDRLTIVNDAFGHQAGDAVLIDLSQRLETRPPIGDAVGRVGGDTFGVVVAQCTAEEMARISERILHELRAAPVETPHGAVFVTASIGGALFDGSESSADVMAKAEVALRQAKKGGRDCFQAYRVEDRSAQSNKTYVRAAERIQAALREDRFVFAYQPIVVAARDGTAGAVSHYECLLRLIDENGQIQAAGAFMPVVEEMGLIRQIDRRVLDMAIGELKRNPTVTLAVNVSAYTAGDRTWLAQIEELLKDRRDLAERLIVEITETVALRDVEESARFVQAVRALGCKVALDDFGAGFTSFRNLRALAVDEVKIDGSYVKNLPDNPDNQVFVRSMVGLARGLKLRTVAECVETEAEARALSAQGVDMFQGYFFGRPNVNPDWRRADPARKVPTKTAA